MFGTVTAGSHLGGERLRFDVIREILHGVSDPVGSLEVDTNPIRYFEARIFAHVLNSIHKLTSEAFVNQFRREGRVECNRQAVSGIDEPSFNARSEERR